MAYPSGVEIETKDCSVLETSSKRPSASVAVTANPSVTATPARLARPAVTRPETRTGRTGRTGFTPAAVLLPVCGA